MVELILAHFNDTQSPWRAGSRPLHEAPLAAAPAAGARRLSRLPRSPVPRPGDGARRERRGAIAAGEANRQEVDPRARPDPPRALQATSTPRLDRAGTGYESLLRARGRPAATLRFHPARADRRRD